jgi:hypothetical protein
MRCRARLVRFLAARNGFVRLADTSARSNRFMRRRIHRPVEWTRIKIQLIEPLANFAKQCGILEFDLVVRLIDAR